MKKFKITFLTILILSLMLFVLGACSDGTTAGGSATGAADIEISDPEFGFIEAEDYDPENFNINTAAKWTTLNADTEYYLFITFDVTARRDNDGQSLLNVNFTFDALNIMEGTMEDVSTGMITEMVFQDAETGNIGKTTTISFKIPSLSANSKTINFIVSLKPVKVGESHIILGYDYDPSDTGKEYRLLGSDGYTKNLKIQAVKIGTPVLNVSTLGSLNWQHVKNADYYCIYEAGGQNPLTDFMGEVIYITAKNTAVGGMLYYNIGEYISGYHTLVIRAFSNNSNILNSDNSNAIEHIW